jgi:hypothetical protein
VELKSALKGPVHKAVDKACAKKRHFQAASAIVTAKALARDFPGYKRIGL